MSRTKKSSRRAYGTGGIIRRGEHFRLRLQIDGKMTEKTLYRPDGSPCTNRADAEKAANLVDRSIYDLDRKERYIEKIAEIRQLKVEHLAASSDVWVMYHKSANRPDTSHKTLKEQKALLERFGNWLQEKYSSGLDGATPVAASEFMHELGEGVSNRTFNGYLSVFRLIFDVVHEQLGMQSNPFAKIRRRPLETFSRKEFTTEQVEAIFNGFHDGFYYETEIEKLGPGRSRVRERTRLEFKPMHKEQMEVLLKMCCYSGCDGQSGCLMKWENVDLAKNCISYIRNKTRKKTSGRVISLPIHPTLHEALLNAQQWQRDDSPYILPDVAERYQRNRQGVQKDVRTIIHCALGVDTTFHGDTGTKRALAPSQYSLHSFRHTFVSFCANAGVPLAIVAEIVGHGNPAMTRHYAHINDKAKMEAIDALPTLDVGAKPALGEESEPVIIDTVAIEKTSIANESQKNKDAATGTGIMPKTA